MSREIPISVHPEFMQGKPRIFTRSSSLPNGPKLQWVVENSNPSEAYQKEQASKTEHTQIADDSPTQRANGNNIDQKYKFWKSSLPVDYPQVQYSSAGKPSVMRDATEGKEQRRHFFRGNPFVGDLDKVFEDHYTSGSPLPVRLARRNTYSAGNLRETLPSAPKIGKTSRRNRKGTSFNIPIQVEFDEIKGGKEGEEEGLVEDKAVKEENERKDNWLESVQDEEKTTKTGSEVDSKQGNCNVLKIGKAACAVNFDKMKDYDDTEMVKDQEVAEKSNLNSSEDVDRGIHEDKANTEQGEEKGEEPQSTESLPQEFIEENESKNKLLTIQSILKKAEKLDKEVNAVSDMSKTKAYVTLEEDLTCLLLELDGIEANRDGNIRLARKRAVQQLQRTLTRLEEKVSCKDVQNSEKEEKDGSCLNRNENVH